VNFHFGDRLQQHRFAFCHPFVHRQTRRLFESLFGTVNAVIGTVCQRYRYVYHRETEGAAIEIFPHSDFHAGNVLFGHDSADYFVGEIEAFSPLLRFDVEVNVTELSVPAALVFVAPVDGRCGFADGFFVRHLW